MYTASGTTAVPVAISVQVTNGLFSVLIGDTTFQGQNSLSNIFNQDSLYLGVTVGADGEMSPRKRLGTVPYAFNAENLQGNFASSTVTSTGGSLFTLHQTTSDAATASRTALLVQTDGTSNAFDFLFRGNNGSSDVFTISRQGNATTTGNLSVLGNTSLQGLTFTTGVGTSVTTTNLFATNFTGLSNTLTNLTVTGTTSLQTLTFTNGTGTNVTTTGLFFTAASGTSLNASAIAVNGSSVCLANGTNCPGAAATTATLQTITNNGALTTNTLQLFGGFIAASSTVTSTFTVLGNTSLQNLTFTNGTGTSVTTTNLFATNGTVTNLTSSNASISGGSINGTPIGNTSPSTGVFTNVTSTNLFATNFTGLSNTLTNLTVTGTTSLQTLTFTNGTATNVTTTGFFFTAASGTSLNASAIAVNGSSVCLANGTNCPAAGSTSLAQVTAVGATTTATLQLFGGFIAASSTVTSTFTVLGNTSLQNLTFTNGTGTSVTTTNFAFTSASGTTLRTTSVLVNGSAVCLANGTNCPGAAATTATLQTITNNGASTTNTLQLLGGFLAASSTVTSTFTVLGNTSLQAFTFSTGVGTSVTTTNLFANNATFLTAGITNLTVTGTTSLQGLTFTTGVGTSVTTTNLFANNATFLTAGITNLTVTGTTSLQNLTLTNGTATNVTTTGFFFTAASGTSLNASAIAVNGSSVCLANGTNCPGSSATTATLQTVTDNGSSTTDTLQLFGGFLAASSTVTSTFTVLGNTSLQGFTFSNGTGTNVTTTNFAFTFASGTTIRASSILVNGQSVCLANGINCSGGVVSSTWQYNRLSNIAFLTTSTQDVLMGGNTTATAGFIWDSGAGTSTLYLGFTTNTNLIVGGSSTTVSFMNSGYALNGNDLFVGGNIGSVSSVYSNGEFVAGTGTTRYGDGYITKANGSLTVSSSQYLFLQPQGGMVGIGTTTPDSVLDISTSTNDGQGIAIRNTGEGANASALADFYNNAGEIGVVFGSATSYSFLPNSASTLGIAGLQSGGLLLGTLGGNINFRTQTDLLAGSDTIHISGSGPTEGYVGFGTSTPSQRLTVLGGIQDTLDPTVSLQVVGTSTYPSGTGLRDMAISGNYGFLVEGNTGIVSVLDLTNPVNPVVIGTSTGYTAPASVAVSGKYLYVTDDGGADTFKIVDISKPTKPTSVGVYSFTNSPNPQDVTVVGRYAYVINNSYGSLNVIDVGDPTHPTLVASTTVSISPRVVVSQGSFLYVLDSVPGSKLTIVDVSNPLAPFVTASTTGLGLPLGLDVQGRYAYVADPFGGSVYVVDISSSTAPTIVGSVPLGGLAPRDLSVNGRYVYTANNNGSVSAIDVSNPQAPFLTSSVTLMSTSTDFIVVSGKYAYAVSDGLGLMNVVDLRGIETSSLRSGSIETGSLDIRSDANVYNLLSVGGGLDVGQGGILSFGPLAVSATNTTSTFVYAVSTTNAEVSSRLTVGGVAVCLSNGTNCPAAGSTSLAQVTAVGATTTATLQLFGGFIAASSTVTSTFTVLGNTSLQGFTFTNGTGTSVTTTNFFTTNFIGLSNTLTNLTVTGTTALQTLTFTNGTGTSVTTTNFAFTSASGTTLRTTSVLVNGSAVCLANGINCSGGVVSSTWQYNRLSNIAFLTTSTQDVLMGGNTTATAGFIWDSGNGTSSLIIGGSTNTNLFVGTSTYGGGLDPQFVLNGNDAIVQGQLGSIGGLFSATGVTVGTGSTFYGDGNLYKTTAGDFTLALNNTASSYRFFNGTTNTLTVASSGNVGIGVTSPTAALDVKGNIRNVIQSGQSMTQVGSLSFISGSSPGAVAVFGKYAYVANAGNSTLAVIDVTNASSPVQISTTTFAAGSQPSAVFVSGRYAYVANFTANALATIDISNPASPLQVATTTLAEPAAVFVSGRYAYVADNGDNKIAVVDISQPTNPIVVSTTTLPGNIFPTSIYVSGRYAYLTGSSDRLVAIVDIANPNAPVTVGTFSLPVTSQPSSIFVSGRYAFVTASGSSTLSIIDVSNPASPTQVATTTFPAGATPQSVFVSGRYAYVTLPGNNSIATVDVNFPSSPVQVATTTVTSATAMYVSGRYAYTANDGSNTFSVLDVGGTETNGLLAHAAELGSLQVLTNGSIANQLTVGGGLTVGTDGILSSGAFAVSATNTTSTFLYAVSTTQAEVSSRLTVGGVAVCLANGTNCPAAGSTSLAQVTAVGATTTATLQLFGGFLAASSTVTSTFTVLGNTSLQGFTFSNGTGTNVTTTNFAFTSASGTTIRASSILVNGQSVCLANGINCSGGVVSSTWQYNRLSNIAFLTTSTQDVLMGGNTTATAGFIWDSGAGTSTLYLGFTTNTNLIVGGSSTTVSFMNSGYALNGNDLFVGGNIGSVSSVYSNGEFVAGTGTTRYGDGYITKANGSLTVSSTGNIALNPGLNGTVTIGTSTPYTANNHQLTVYSNVNGSSGIFVSNAATGTAATADFDLGNDQGLSGNLALTNSSYSILPNATNTLVLASSNDANVMLASLGAGDINFRTISDIFFGTDTIHIEGTGPTEGFTTFSKAVTVDGRLDAPYLTRINQVPLLYQTVHGANATTTVGGGPWGMAFDGTYLWVGNSTSTFVSKVDVLTNQVVDTVDIGGNPEGLAFDGTDMWVANNSSGTVVKIDVNTDQVIATTTVTTSPDNLAFDGTHMWVTNTDTPDLLKIDVTTNQVVATTTLPDSSFAIAFDGSHMWVGENFFLGSNIWKVDFNTNQVVATTTITDGATPSQLAFDGSHMWVGSAAGEVFKLNVQTNQIVATTTIDAGGASLGMAFDGVHMWVSDNTNGVINKIDVNTNSVISTSTAGGEVRGLVFDGTHLWAANYDNNSVSKLDIGGGFENEYKVNGTLTVGGVSVCLANGTNCPAGGSTSLAQVTAVGATTTATLQLFGGFLAASSTVTSTFTVLGNTSLQGFTFSNGTGTNVTTTNFAFTSASGTTIRATSILVNGSSVCLANGTNCLGGVASTTFQYNKTSNISFLTTSTQDLLLGGNTTATAGFIWDSGNGTSSLFIGGSTNTNLFVGTSTYGGGLNSQFVMNGNDVIVQGQLGSIGGLFSATGVSVGTGTSVYGDGNLFKTTAGDFTLALNDTGSSWRFFNGTTNTLTVASSGNIGIGITSPLEALDVKGNIKEIIRSGQTISVKGSASISSQPEYIAVAGNYAYVTRDPSTFSVIDVTDLASSSQIGSVTVGSTPLGIAVEGKYAYVVNNADANVSVVDVSRPTSPVQVATVTVGSSPRAIAVQGKYAYVTNQGSNTVSIIDISNPLLPVRITNVTVGSTPFDIAVAGAYVYVTNNGGSSMSIVDVKNPQAPVLTGTVAVGTGPQGIDVSGKYAYVTNNGSGGGNTISVVDVKNPTAPFVAGTSTVGLGPNGIAVAGRYAYVMSAITSPASVIFSIVDVSSSTNPTALTTTTVALVGTTAQNLAVAGRFAYVEDNVNNQIKIIDIGGTEVSSLLAHSAEVGTLQVLSNGVVANDFTVRGGLNVGTGGLLVDGTLGVSGNSLFSSRLDAPYLNMRSWVPIMYQSISGRGATTAVGTTPIGVAFDGSHIWVTNNGSGSVSKIDPLTNSVVATTTVGTNPNGIAFDGNYIWVVNSGSNNVSKIDIMSNQVVATTAVGTSPLGIAFDGSSMWVTNNGSANASKINITTNLVVATTTLSGSVNALAFDGSSLWAAIQSAGVVVKINVTTNNVVATTTVGGTPQGMAFDGTHLWVANNADGTVSKIDIGTNLVVATTTVGTNPRRIAFDGSAVWVVNGGANTVSKIDPMTNTVVATTTVGTSPEWIAFDGTHLWIANDGSASVSKIQIGGGTGNTFGVNGILSVQQSLPSVTSTFLFNSSSNTAPVLEVRGGCDNANSSTNSVLILAGNTTKSRKFRVGCNGTVAIDGSFNTGGADYAEYFSKTSSTVLNIGDVVALTGTSSGTLAVAASADLRDQTLGIVSGNPGFLGNDADGRETDPSFVKVSLMGQVPASASAVSAAISAGDTLMAGDDGMVVKAKGPGMVIGTAIDALASGTGTISVLVDPHWWAGDLLTSGANGNLLIADLTVVSTTVADATTTLADSPLFTFQGSAWDDTSSTVATSSFSLMTDMLSASSSRFSIISNVTSSPILTVSPLGDLAIAGKLYPSDRGVAQYDKYIYYDGSSGLGGDFMRTNASGWGTGSYDFAEMFPSNDQLEPGDIVVVDPLNPEGVKKSTSVNEGNLLGIVSTRPGFLAGENATSTYPIALAGRVPTKVTTSNGAIHIGDPLAASAIPGVAMKAVGTTPIVGVALQDFDAPYVTSVIAYVNVSWHIDTSSSSSGGQTSTASTDVRKGFAKIAAGSTSVHVAFPTINAYPMILATPSGDAGFWWLGNQSDVGFDIVLGQAETHDVTFTWSVEATPAGTTMWNSDNTSAQVDPTSGQLVPQSPTMDTQTSSSTSSTSSDLSPDSGTSTTP